MLGIDFTSAPRPRKPITVAVGDLTARSRDPVYRLETVRPLETFAAFEAFLREPGPWLGGFDLPFGQPRTLIEHEGWPTDWREFVRFYCGQLAQQFFASATKTHRPGAHREKFLVLDGPSSILAQHTRRDRLVRAHVDPRPSPDRTLTGSDLDIRSSSRADSSQLQSRSESSRNLDAKIQDMGT